MIFPKTHHQVRTAGIAQKRIEEIKSSKSNVAGHASLPAIYSIIWERNADDETRHLQTRVFQILICAFVKLTLKQITEALRIELPDDTISFADLSETSVKAFFNNFVSFDATNKASWIHESAREFVLSQSQGGHQAFSDAEAHFAMASICIGPVTNTSHNAWQRSGYSFSGIARTTLSLEIRKSDLPAASNAKQHLIRHIEDNSGTWFLETGRDLVPEQALQDCGWKSFLEGKTFLYYAGIHFLFHLRAISENVLHDTKRFDLLRELFEAKSLTSFDALLLLHRFAGTRQEWSSMMDRWSMNWLVWGETSASFELSDGRPPQCRVRRLRSEHSDPLDCA